MALSVKVCRDCGEEYRLEAIQCADCGGELEVRALDESGERTQIDEAPPEPTEARNHRVVFVTPAASELVPLVEALRAGGVPHRLAEQSARASRAAPRYALLVPEEEAAAALRILAPLLAPEAQAEHVESIESRFQPEHGYLRCPACGAEQAGKSLECAECGLGLGEPSGETSCEGCGITLSAPGEPCPACGGSKVE